MLGKRDSEVAVLLTDEAFEDGKMDGKNFPCGKYAGSLRKYLFREHLGIFRSNKNSIDVTDPICDTFYKDIWQKTSRQNTRIYEDVFRCIPNDNVRSFLTMKKFNEEPALNKTNPEEAEKALTKIQGFLVDLPLNFLCEENLLPSNFSREGIVGMDLWT
jgi:phospholipase D1/2